MDANGLGGRLIAVVSEWDETLAVYNFSKFESFSSGAILGCLNKFVVLIPLYQ